MNHLKGRLLTNFLIPQPPLFGIYDQRFADHVVEIPTTAIAIHQSTKHIRCSIHVATADCMGSLSSIVKDSHALNESASRLHQWVKGPFYNDIHLDNVIHSDDQHYQLLRDLILIYLTEILVVAGQ